MRILHSHCDDESRNPHPCQVPHIEELHMKMLALKSKVKRQYRMEYEESRKEGSLCMLSWVPCMLGLSHDVVVLGPHMLAWEPCS